MGRFILSGILTAILWCSCSTQDMADAPLFMLKAIIDGIDEILKEVKGQGARLATLEESQKKIEDSMKEPREEHQNCVTREQAEIMQATSSNENQEILSSLQQCLTKDQFSDFYNLLGKDECNEGSHQCNESATCTDEFINYRCSCLPGFSGDGFTCLDIDECVTGNLMCDVDAHCVNSVGSFQCVCNTGYEGDGYTCDLKCESPSVMMEEDLGCVTPVLTELSWDEARDNCIHSGSRLIENIQQKHFQILYDHFSDSINGDLDMPWIGIRNARWVSSGDSVHASLYHNYEPDGGNQECGHFHIKESCLGLGDGYCDSERYSFCQRL